MAGIAFGAIDLHSVWLLWHFVTSALLLRGRRCTYGIERSPVMPRQVWHLVPSAFILCGRRGTWCTGLVLVARLVARDAATGVAFGAIDLHSVWQPWHVTLAVLLCGGRPTYGTGLALLVRLLARHTAALCGRCGICSVPQELLQTCSNFSGCQLQVFSPRHCGGLLFFCCALPSASPSLLLLVPAPFTHNFVTDTQLFHAQLSHARNFVTHNSVTHITHTFAPHTFLFRQVLLQANSTTPPGAHFECSYSDVLTLYVGIPLSRPLLVQGFKASTPTIRSTDSAPSPGRRGGR